MSKLRFKTVYRNHLKRLLLVVTFIALPVIAWAQWGTSGSNIYNSNAGNVGIGTSTPNANLEVAGYIFVTGTNAGIRAQGTGQIQLQFINNGSGTDSKISEIIDQSGQISFRTVNDGYSNAAHYMQVARNANAYTINNVSFPNGNVGIGTTSPTSKLEVVGDVTVSGNISAKYQDIAEWVPTSRPISPGTVVVLDSKNVNSVVPSSDAYDTRVAGVVSSTPGLILGVAGEGKVRVATTGRVKVRTEATGSPIQIGDLLVTSPKEGFAMRSEPMDVAGSKLHRPGTLIGKALEPLNEGEGEILVLLSLQ